MKRRVIVVTFVFSALLVSAGHSFFRALTSGESLTASASKYLSTLDKKQLAKSTMAYDSEKRVDWHFIPKDHRKGLQIKEMNETQRKAALALLKNCLSEVGNDKAIKIMELEKVLAEYEKDRKGGNIRDPERYYYTVFGEPKADGKWGLSIEGHHLSLNFVIEKNEVISSTPQFLAANPGVMMSAAAGVKKGQRVLADEELVAFELVNSLSDEQKKQAIIAKKAPREIRAAGAAQPPADEKVGIRVGDLTDEQKQTIRKLVSTYIRTAPEDVARQRVEEILNSNIDDIRFAWAGPTKPGVGHYYRVQGEAFLVEFVNTQPDAAGNPANHIHAVFRSMSSDFALPAK
ncbi:MAG: DUF3500 domain-containing protein [Pirellulaceae bacterium]|jgi:hypothetical protein|nr:DUF3500 domain-containing protein [Pirellulaceae bacterium]MDP7017104.1 DUF3500 domain-containing protein [Pirellulaceae bacterium]